MALLYVAKTSHYFHCYFSQNDHCGNIVGWTGNSEYLTWKNDTLRSGASNIKIQGEFAGLEERNDNHGKALHTVVMDSGFTVSVNGAGYESCFYPVAYVH
jgi:hypothetical protein